MSIISPVRTADTSTPIIEVLAERWSPRAFDPIQPIDETKLTAALEAARWSPSAANSQPWRFIVARRGSAEFTSIKAALVGFNSAWAGSAGALVVAIAEMTDADGTARTWAQYDLGQAIAHFSVQAHADDLHVHQMGGFDADALRASFDLAENLVPLSVTAVGNVGSPDQLPEGTREREMAPRERRALEELLVVNS
ncbi:MAG: nitroreductase [Microbacteriaceae bacterium]|jgi:nitroreductase|nr:nitroreductase [Microbacteriaceae bacterium]HEV7955777.1 nitroreductase family protein [Marisediminicola sp.]